MRSRLLLEIYKRELRNSVRTRNNSFGSTFGRFRVEEGFEGTISVLDFGRQIQIRSRYAAIGCQGITTISFLKKIDNRIVGKESSIHWLKGRITKEPIHRFSALLLLQ